MISVLLATHNGADTIERTLAAMSALAPPPDGWELIVVNNASSDDTEARILKWHGRLPLRYLLETRLGKSKAMNTALAQAQGDFIVMTDDDVLPDPDWLTEWRRVADAWPRCAVFGGAITPEFGDWPPRQPMSRVDLTVLYAQTPDYAEGEIPPTDVSGPNMAVRRQALEEGLRFDEDFLVGRYGLMGEDSEFVRRAARAGYGIGFAPTARVRHIIHKEQMSLRWMLHRFFRHGRTMFLFENVRENPLTRKPEFDFPRWRVRRAVTGFLRLMVLAPTFQRTLLFKQARTLAYDLGALRQAWILSRQRSPSSSPKR